MSVVDKFGDSPLSIASKRHMLDSLAAKATHFKAPPQRQEETEVDLGDDRLGGDHRPKSVHERHVKLIADIKSGALTTVSIKDTPVLEEHVHDLVAALKDNKNVKTICLHNNNLGPQLSWHLFNALPTTAITTLDVSNNGIGDIALQVLSQYLKSNTTITTLILKRNGISDEGMAQLYDGLASNQTVMTINLKWNDIGGAGAKKVAELLGVNKSINSINLGGNHIDDTGVAAIFKSLSQNNTFSTLKLKHNHITSSSAPTITEAITKNQGLKVLDLGSNQFRSEAAIAIARSSASHPSLTHLNLAWVKAFRSVGSPAIEVFKDVMKAKPTLTISWTCRTVVA